jgi:chaperonin GroEL
MALWEKGKSKVAVPMNAELKAKIARSLKLFCDITAVTMGPGGRVVLIERDGLSPLATKDGVTVAKAVNVYDAVENIIIECVKEVAERTGKQAGDGTTTSVVLAEAIVRYGTEWLSNNPSVSPQKFMRDLTKDYNNIAKPYLTGISVPINSDETIRHVALMSANGDDVVADAVVEAILSSGDDGAILLEESSGKDTRCTVQEGFAMQKGLDFLGSLSNIFVNNERDMECVLDRPLIVLFNGTLRDVNLVADVVQKNMNTGDIRPMVFVAHDFSDDVKSLFAINFKQGSIKIVPVITPRDGTPMGKDLMMQDLAAYTNAKIFDGTNMKQCDLKELGDCDRFRMSRWQTVFIGEPDQETVAKRIEDIKAQVEFVHGDIDAEIYKERIARLTGGVTTIFVGGLSDLEVREVKARVEDAVCAVRSALKQGVVPGGATTMLKISELNIHPVLQQALKEPIRRLLDNAGLQDGAITAICSEVLGVEGKVYNVLTHELVDPWKDGIIDPCKVIDSAISNALSVAGTLVTLGGVVVVPRDINLENQAALTQVAFNNMMQGET